MRDEIISNFVSEINGLTFRNPALLRPSLFCSCVCVGFCFSLLIGDTYNTFFEVTDSEIRRHFERSGFQCRSSPRGSICQPCSKGYYGGDKGCKECPPGKRWSWLVISLGFHTGVENLSCKPIPTWGNKSTHFIP